MSRFGTRLVFQLLLLCFSFWAGGLSARAIDRTIAKINDDILTESDLAEIVAEVSGQFNSKFVSAFDSATTETVASMLDRALLVQEARRLKITPPAEELNSQVETMVQDMRANFASETEFHQALATEHISLDQLKSQLVEKVKTDYMVFQVVNSRFSVSEQEIQDFAAKQSADGQAVESFRLRRLGISVNENRGAEAACREARALVARIITAGISFEEGIRRYSQVPGAEADAGDMGYMSKDKLSVQVRQAVEDLEVGQASAPVVAGGYANVFYVDGKRGARSAIRERKFFQAREELLSSLRRRALLQVFDERLMKRLPDFYRTALVNAAGVAYSPPGASSEPAPSTRQHLAAPADPSHAQQYALPQPAATPTPQPTRLRRWLGNRQ